MFSGCRYFLNRGVELIEDNPEQARSHFETALKFNPFNGEGYAFLAKSYHMDEDIEAIASLPLMDKVVENYKKSLDNGYEERWVYATLGEIFKEKSRIISHIEGNYEEGEDYGIKAINYLEKANEIEPQVIDYYFMGYVKLYGFEDEAEKSLDYFKKAYDLDNTDWRALLGLGYAHTALDDHYKAFEYYKESVEQRRSALAYNGWGHAYYILENDPAGAIDLFHRAYEIDPENITTIYNLAMMYDYVGAEETANIFWEELEEFDEKGVYDNYLEGDDE